VQVNNVAIMLIVEECFVVYCNTTLFAVGLRKDRSDRWEVVYPELHQTSPVFRHHFSTLLPKGCTNASKVHKHCSRQSLGFWPLRFTLLHYDHWNISLLIHRKSSLWHQIWLRKILWYLRLLFVSWCYHNMKKPSEVSNKLIVNQTNLRIRNLEL